MILQVLPLRFVFCAGGSVSFPQGKAANIFRGAFGQIFRRVACAPECTDVQSCSRVSECVYARMFEPRAGITAFGHANPSGFEDRPRPFVFRAASLDGRRFEAGEKFALEVNVFDPYILALPAFRMAFEQLCEEGLGPGRPPVRLVTAKELPPVSLDLAVRRDLVDRIKVTFLTPTELKSSGDTLREPRFDVLLKRARDRVTGLIQLYQPTRTNDQPDFRGMGDRAATVCMIDGRIQQVKRERRSSRTGQSHSLGGFTGEAIYEGNLSEFLPYLNAVWWTGVGRLTVWGNGQACAEVLNK